MILTELARRDAVCSLPAPKENCRKNFHHVGWAILELPPFFRVYVWGPRAIAVRAGPSFLNLRVSIRPDLLLFCGGLKRARLVSRDVIDNTTGNVCISLHNFVSCSHCILRNKLIISESHIWNCNDDFEETCYLRRPQ